MAPPLVAPKASEAGSPLEGADGNTGGVDCKGRDPKGDPEPWVARSSPKATTAPSAARHTLPGVAGMGVPPWGFL